jgi:hypothetical protein
MGHVMARLLADDNSSFLNRMEKPAHHQIADSKNQIADLTDHRTLKARIKENNAKNQDIMRIVNSVRASDALSKQVPVETHFIELSLAAVPGAKHSHS